MTIQSAAKALLPLAVAGCLGAAALSAATSPATGQETAGSTTYRVLLKSEEDFSVDRRPRGETVGDEIFYAATLTSAGRKAGRIEANCVNIDKRFEGQLCTGVLLLTGGTIAFMGGGTHKPVPGGGDGAEKYAVTGGTGKFANASGVLAFEGATKLIITLA